MTMMLSLVILALSLAQGGLSTALEPRNCRPGNNCARAVTGTGAHVTPSLAVRRADCSSFMLVTVTPPATLTTQIITAYTTTTTTIVEPPSKARRAPRGNANGGGDDLVKRQTVSPSVLPTYASACTDIAEYSSICSCWGITQSTTTLPPSVSVTTTTTTETITATASVCPGGYTQCGADCKNLQTDPSNCGSCGNTCAPGSTCQSGTCTSPPPPPGSCTNVVTACPVPENPPSGPFYCGGACASNTCFPSIANSAVGYCGAGTTGCGDLADCASDADCASTGGKCLVTCCNGSGAPAVPKCFTPAELCPNPLAPRNVFARRAVGVVEKRGSGVSVNGHPVAV